MLRASLPFWGLITALSLALFYHSIFFDFSYDDFWQIQRNPLVTESSNWLEIFSTATPPGNLYRPLSTLSYKISYGLFGENPLPYHLFNLLLYAGLACLVFELCRPLVNSSKVALVASLAFVVHPAHVEAVCSVVGRAELLAAFFGILCCMTLAKHQFCSALFLLLAVLSKESALAFALLAPLYLYYQEQGNPAALHKKAWPLFAACVCALALRFSVLGLMTFAHEGQSAPIAENPIAHLDFFQRIVPALKVQGEYVRLLFMPIKLSADYSSMPREFIANVYSKEGFLLILLFLYLVFAIYFFRKQKFGYFGFWYLIACIPTANLFFPIGTIMGERLIFTPSIGLIVWFVALLARQAQLPKMRVLANPIIVVLCLGVFGFHSWLRAPVWQDNYALFSQTALDAPQSPKSAFNFAVELHKRGELDSAIDYFHRCIDLDADHLVAAGNLADIYLKKRQFGRVEYWYRYILQRDPANIKVQDALEKLLLLKTPRGHSPFSPT